MANEFQITRFEAPIEDENLAREIRELWNKVPEQIGQASDLSTYIETGCPPCRRAVRLKPSR
jgi:hypothetical protein